MHTVMNMPQKRTRKNSAEAPREQRPTAPLPATGEDSDPTTMSVSRKFSAAVNLLAKREKLSAPKWLDKTFGVQLAQMVEAAEEMRRHETEALAKSLRGE
jgi:hypothetical protein